jgi:hypothetical protein
MDRPLVGFYINLMRDSRSADVFFCPAASLCLRAVAPRTYSITSSVGQRRGSTQERGDELLMRWRVARVAGIPTAFRLPEDDGL